MFAAFALLVLVWSCRTEVPDVPAYLDVYVTIPSPEITRATTGDVDSDREAEDAVNSLNIWVFNSSDGSLVGYLSPSSNELRSGKEQRFSVSIDAKVAEAKPDVDVYVLANQEAAGLSLGEDATTDYLKAATLSGEKFGVTSPVTAVPNEGLPMSGCALNQKMSGTAPVMAVPTVKITRMVSKMRFIFCQMADEDGPVGDFKVTGIQLDGGLIANTEYAFNTTTDAWNIGSDGYASSPISFAAPSVIASSQSPGDYSWHDGDTPQGFEDRIAGGIEKGELTDAGRVYLRETDKPLTGKITYTVAGVQKEKTFKMVDPGDFSRNHTWTVYAYFVGGKLYVQPCVMPWIAGGDRLHYSTQGETIMEWISYLRYDVDKNSSTWNDTYAAVAYGYVDGTNVPTCSPEIVVKTSNNYDILLQVNNEAFCFVVVTGTEKAPVYTLYNQSYRIPHDASGGQVTTKFFLVPVNNSLPADPHAKVVLTELSSAPHNLPYNHELPGDEDHTSILFYDIGSAEYTANKDNKKVSGTDQNSNYWTENRG